MWNFLTESFLALKNTFGWTDLLDIALMSVLIYQFCKLVRHTRATQLVKGIVVLMVAFVIALSLNLETILFVFDSVFQVGLLAIVVVFQPELRRALERVGRRTLSGTFSVLSGRQSTETVQKWKETIATVCDSVKHMSDSRTGAILVLERSTGLNEIIHTGTILSAEVSSDLIETIFYEGSPLHDGAVIIRDARIEAAGCVLPLTTNGEVSRDMGTRHRAAIGMSENSDAIVVVVSEETGIISVAENGMVLRRLDRTKLHKILTGSLIPEPKTTGKRVFGLKKSERSGKSQEEV